MTKRPTLVPGGGGQLPLLGVRAVGAGTMGTVSQKPTTASKGRAFPRITRHQISLCLLLGVCSLGSEAQGDTGYLRGPFEAQ